MGEIRRIEGSNKELSNCEKLRSTGDEVLRMRNVCSFTFEFLNLFGSRSEQFISPPFSDLRVYERFPD